MEPVLLKLNSDIFGDIDKMIQLNVGVKSTFRFHTHDYYEFFYVTDGRALHIVNDSTQVLTRGSLVLIRPSDRHAYDYYKKDDFVFYNAGISTEQFHRAIGYYNIDASQFDSPLIPPKVQLDGEKAASFKQLLTELKDAPDGHERQLMYSRTVAEVIYHILTATDNYNLSEYPSWLLELLAEMDKPENFTAGLERMLLLANYSQAYVNRVFQQYLYTTPTKYINSLKIRYARHLLLTTEISVTEISILCGFNSISQFNTIFKEKYGDCPSSLRKHNNIITDMSD